MLIVIIIPWNRYFVAHTPPHLESAWTNSVFFLTTLRKQHTWRRPAFRRQIQYILYKIHKLRWRQHKQHREVKCSADEFRLLSSHYLSFSSPSDLSSLCCLPLLPSWPQLDTFPILLLLLSSPVRIKLPNPLKVTGESYPVRRFCWGYRQS